jgi:hypothetical protein
MQDCRWLKTEATAYTVAQHLLNGGLPDLIKDAIITFGKTLGLPHDQAGAHAAGTTI